MSFIDTIAPALSDVPLTILAIVVVGMIVYRVLASNSRSNDQLYKLFERTIASNDKLSDAITSLEKANRDTSDADRLRHEREQTEIINALQETEARIISAIYTTRKHEGD